MTYLTAVLLGLVQGVAEFLPVSSSGHLALLQNIFGVEEADLLFDVLLHLGTLLAILVAYRRDIRAILSGGLGLLGLGRDRGRTTKNNADRRRMAVFIVVGSLPLLLVLPVRSAVASLYQSTAFVSLMLMVTGGILYLTGKLRPGTKGLREIGFGQVLLVGLGQALAVLPGISQSGTTISLALACGFRQQFAVRFSFLLSIPAVLGAAILTISQAASTEMDISLLPQYLCGMASAAVSGYFSIRLLRYLAEKNRFGGFAYYCWGAGIIALMLSLIA
jgi:undecaprenyl-diphosphatase